MVQKVNLYADRFKPKRGPTSGRGILAILLACAALSLLSIVGEHAWESWRSEQIAQLEAEAAAWDGRIKALEKQFPIPQPDPILARQIAHLERRITERKGLLSVFEGRNLGVNGGFAALFDELGRDLVEGVWLSRIRLKQGGARMSLAGHSLQASQIPRFLESLSDKPSFQGRLFRIFKVEDQQQGRFDFTLSTHELDESELEKALGQLGR
ncbi:PilN domain-containing protein [Magnetofaba australis]|uniref:Putative MshA biogenesis protein MshI-2 n=1 Tax=Magnetofaba australis IT-1 TaxID=1434232 RepID=A0A1Y2K0Z4_9PROT|nr:PilN domain-containing protein [Magnetofaba australis]OSM01713.1 putative MshA biogenesis protein MshI-2 [Magnetofaba australis IT-1]